MHQRALVDKLLSLLERGERERECVLPIQGCLVVAFLIHNSLTHSLARPLAAMAMATSASGTAMAMSALSCPLGLAPSTSYSARPAAGVATFSSLLRTKFVAVSRRRRAPCCMSVEVQDNERDNAGGGQEQPNPKPSPVDTMREIEEPMQIDSRRGEQWVSDLYFINTRIGVFWVVSGTERGGRILELARRIFFYHCVVRERIQKCFTHYQFALLP